MINYYSIIIDAPSLSIRNALDSISSRPGGELVFGGSIPARGIEMRIVMCSGRRLYASVGDLFSLGGGEGDRRKNRERTVLCLYHVGAERRGDEGVQWRCVCTINSSVEFVQKLVRT